MNLDSMHATVGEFLAVLGLLNIPWQGESLVLDLGRTRYLYIEFTDRGILFSLGKAILAADLETILPAALKATHYKQGLPFNTQVGVIGERELLFSLFFLPSQVTISALFEGLEILQNLHDQS